MINKKIFKEDCDTAETFFDNIMLSTYFFFHQNGLKHDDIIEMLHDKLNDLGKDVKDNYEEYFNIYKKGIGV
jgi:hypothetical protein